MILNFIKVYTSGFVLEIYLDLLLDAKFWNVFFRNNEIKIAKRMRGS